MIASFKLLAAALLAAASLACGPVRAAERQIVDAAGRTVLVPAQARRIVALSELDLDALLALDLKPAGATRGRGQDGPPRYLGAQARALPVAGNFAAPVLDLVIGMQPDLILAGGLADPQLISQLARIAPTVLTYRPGEHWQTALARIGAATGRASAADAFLVRYRERAATLRARLGAHADATVSVVRWNPQGPAYMLKDAFASLVLADLQLRRPQAQQQPGAAHSPPLSLEALDRIDADWLFVGTLGASGPASDSLAAARATPGFRQLGAVKANRLRVVDGSLWSGPGGPLAALAILADVEAAMGAR